MKNIVMVKRGVGTVELTQTDNGEYILNTGVMPVNLGSAEKLNGAYLAYRNAGYVVKEDVAKASPREKTTANRIIWSKDGKRLWAAEYNFRKSQRLPEIRNLTGKAYHEARINLEAELKAEMKVWEAENAEKINAFLQNVVWKIAK